MKRHIHYLLFLLAATCTIVSGQGIDIKGKVVNEALQPVAGAKIKLKVNDIEVISATDGTFHLTGDVSIRSGMHPFSPSGFIGLRNNRIELGSYRTAEITVLSIRGAVLNRVSVEKRNAIPVGLVIPSVIRSQAVVIMIRAGGETYSVRTIKCGAHWLGNGTSVTETRRVNGTFAAGTVVLDTLRVKMGGYKTHKEPLASLITTVNDVILIAEKDDAPTIIGDITFSEPSKTFKDQLSIGMSTALADAEIRYTVDGTVPAADATLYAGTPIVITATTQVRAQAFTGGTPAGTMSTAIYIARTFDFTSDIPIVVMDGYGRGKPQDKVNFIDLAFFTFEPVEGTASLANEPTLAARAGYHLRGQSSMMFKKAPYRVELWDNEDNDADYPVLGMPDESDWAMIGPYTDKTLIRNAFVYALGKDMGLCAMQLRFAEVYINQEDSPLEPEDYQGVYTVVQTIKNQKSRLDLKQLKEDDVDPGKLSGGYIFKFDQMAIDSGEVELECVGADKMGGGFNFNFDDFDFWDFEETDEPGNAKRLAADDDDEDGHGGWGGWNREIDSTATCWDDLELVDPSPANQQQITWITDYIQQFHDALHAEPIGNWMEYVDLPSFVDLYIMNEVTRDVDAYIRSHYMHKERDEPITCGPLWDYNFSLGNLSNDSEGWHWEENRRGTNDWHLIIWKQPQFKSAAKTRWQELRSGLLSDVSIDQYVASISAPLAKAAEHDLEKWPIGETGGMWSMFGNRRDEPETWELQIESMKTWTKDRVHWLDSAFAAQ